MYYHERVSGKHSMRFPFSEANSSLIAHRETLAYGMLIWYCVVYQVVLRWWVIVFDSIPGDYVYFCWTTSAFDEDHTGDGNVR